MAVPVGAPSSYGNQGIGYETVIWGTRRSQDSEGLVWSGRIFSKRRGGSAREERAEFMDRGVFVIHGNQWVHDRCSEKIHSFCTVLGEPLLYARFFTFAIF